MNKKKNKNSSHTIKPLKWAQSEGCAFPLGATVVAEDSSVNFAIYSKHATSVWLLLFTNDNFQHPCYRYEFDYLKNKSGSVFHCRLPLDTIGEARFYGYQIDGPAPANGFSCHSFDSEKLLLDPYARSVHFPPEFSRKAAMEPGSNVRRAPLGCLPHLPGDLEQRDPCRLRHDHDLVIYEMHVKGFTANPSSEVSPDGRGKYSGVVEKIPYLLELGVTAVELLPIFQFDPEADDYWGYMPLGVFAPHGQYSTSTVGAKQQEEFREMVRAFHAAGIEVILDVVFNHTSEGGLDGPTYSLKGIDNSTYYMLDPNADNPFVNFSGTGNTLHTVYGSADHFPDDRLHAFRLLQSVNYVASHDGMTMYDLASYEKKNNWANGQENQDGLEEFRCNCGREGELDLPSDVLRKRIRLVKNFFAILMLSNGTPMFRMGDEFLQTQLGNNNPFNQDNKTSWLDWDRLKQHDEVFQFFRKMIAFRKSHPSISRSRFWRNDIHWFGTAHEPDLSATSKSIAWCLHGASQQDNDLYVMLNMHDETKRFGIFEGAGGDWRLVIETSRDGTEDIVTRNGSTPVNESFIDVNPGSVVVLVR